MNKKLLPIPILMLCLLNCTFFYLIFSHKLKNPSVKFVACEINDITVTRTTVDLIISAYNPNEIGLKNVTVSYQLFAENKRFLQGKDIQLDLKPKDTSIINVHAEVIFKEVFMVVGPVSEKILLNKKSIPVRIDAVISGDPTVYNNAESGSLIPFTIKISKTVDVPLTKVEKKLKKEVDKVVKKVF